MDDVSFAQAVGQRISRARQAAHLTQAELATRVGWPRDTLIHYEHGRRALSIARLAELAAALGIHPATLLIGDDDARLIGMLLANHELRSQVLFFVSTLDD